VKTGERSGFERRVLHGCFKEGSGNRFVKKIYVGNLPWSATESEVRDFFSAYGDIASVSIVMDRETGRSRGFAFVEMNDADAARAIADANGKPMSGRPLRINEAQERARTPRPRRP
jgi:RNA recognition motif-containing protein